MNVPAESQLHRRATNGCAREADGTRDRSASPTTRRRRWAISSSSSCPRSAARSPAGEACAVVESVKAASDVYAPVAGEVVAVNEALADAPEKVNEDAYAAWFFRLQARRRRRRSRSCSTPRRTRQLIGDA